MTLYDNHERSLIGDKWYAYGESEKSFTLICHEVIVEDDEYVYIDISKFKEGSYCTLLPIKRENYFKNYPIQNTFPKPMEEEEALDILRSLFS